MGNGGVTPGTRPFWASATPAAHSHHHHHAGAGAGIRGRKDIVRKLRASLAASPIAVLVGASGSGRTSAVARFVDSSRETSSIAAATTATVGGIARKTAEATSEYNVILWLDAGAGHTGLHAQLAEIQAYLRIHSMRYVSSRSSAQQR